MSFEKYRLPNFKEVTPTPETLKNFSDARANVVLGSAIFAFTMMRCEYIFTHDIPTAGACVHDERNIIYFNPDFMDKVLKNSKQRAFVLVHELDHIFFMHQRRAIDMAYNHQVWNEATDFCINLRGAGVYKDEHGVRRVEERYSKYFEMPEIGLYDEKYLGMSSDEIYQHLMKNPEDSPSGGGKQNHGNGGTDLDVLLGNGGSVQQQAKNVQTMHSAVVFAEQSNQIGKNEGDLARAVRDMAKPTISWQDKFVAAVQSSVKVRPTYNHLSRRSSVDGGVVFPTYTGMKVNVVFGVDSSGSMGEDDYRKVLGELKGLLEQFESWTVHLVCCDMKLYEIGVYSSEDHQTFEDIDFEMKGLGGTDMAPIARHADYLMALGEDIDACIVLTDGYIDVGELDNAFPREIKNLVITTRNHNLEFINAESIAVK